MRQDSTPLMNQCPICGRGEIRYSTERTLFRRRRVLPCPSCGAVMAPVGSSSFGLQYCAPHKLGPQGCRRCAGYLYKMCFLDRAFSLADWERMARHQPPAEVELFQERSRRLASGDLPTIEVASLSGQLAPGEVVHYFSQPVFTDPWYRSGTRQGGGTLYVTNRRLLFCAAETCSSLPYEGIEELKEEYPGFYVKLRRDQVPHYFYPPALDPVFSATVGALKNFRQAGTTPEA